MASEKNAVETPRTVTLSLTHKPGLKAMLLAPSFAFGFGYEGFPAACWMLDQSGS